MTLQAQKKTITGFAYTPAHAGLLQRKCACGGSAGLSGDCEGCDEKRLNLQRQPNNESQPESVPPIVKDVLRSRGQPLDQVTRAFMEPRFGYDFSQVRVHADNEAAASARAVNALAYTVGHKIVFGSGEYTPHTSEGKHLLAHELTHVVQQNQQLEPSSPSNLSMIPTASATESEADVAAMRVSSGASIGGLISQGPLSVRRKAAAGKCSNAEIKNCTDEDLLTAICIGEAGNIKDEDGKKGVMYVALNRVADGSFGKDIQSVATATGQFLGLTNGINKLDDQSFAECRDLAKEVMASPANDPTSGAVFFDQSCVKPCDQYCTVYLGDGKSPAHYFARRASESEKANCKDKKKNPQGLNRYCCLNPKQRVYVLPEVEIVAGAEAETGTETEGEKETNKGD